MPSSPPPAAPSSGRFELACKLGEGGMGVVFEALDRASGERVALKRVHELEPDAIYRIKREFRSLATAVHPNLVRLYELVCDDGDWFFTMELVRGVPFLDYLRPGEEVVSPPSAELATSATAVSAPSAGAPRPARRWSAGDGEPTFATSAAVTLPRPGVSTGSPEAARARTALGLPDDLPRLRAAFAQLATGVQALHDGGLLHRDLKPSNVLVERGGRVVLLDFGVITELSGKHSRELVGTPAYIAPELTRAPAVPSPAADWYAVGVMLYEALTGTRPFRGSVELVLAAKRECDALSPRALGVEVPRDLEALCVELLARDPARRPTGPEIARRLGVAADAVALSAPTGASLTAELCGREHHLAALHDAYRDVRLGHGAAVYVRGPSGMGKTALVQRFLSQRAEAGDALIFTGRCYERETVPYKAVDSVIDALASYLVAEPPAWLADQLPADTAMLARVFPALTRCGPIADAAAVELPAVDPPELRRRSFRALRELLHRMSRRQPLVVFIDDLQWGDLDSAPLLDTLMRPPRPPRLLLLASYRSEQEAESPLLRALFRREARLGPAAATRHVEVARLDDADSRRLAAALIPGASERAVARIADESGGHPYFIHELARALRERGDQLDAVDVQLDEVIRARVASLPDDERAALEVIAVSGKPTPAAIAIAAAGLARSAVGLLPPLETAQLVKASDGRAQPLIECYHDRIREAIASSLHDARRRAIHAALANAYAARPAPDPETLCHHYHAAGDLAAAARHAERAAAQAEAALAFDRAAELYRMALSAGELAAGDRQSLLRRLGDALVNAGRGYEAGMAYLDAATGAAPSEDIDLRRRAAFELLKSGHLDEGMRTLAGVLRDLGVPIAASARRALPGLAVKRAHLWLRGLRFAARAEATIDPLLLARIDACWSAGVGLGMVDTFRAADLQSRCLLLSLRAGEPYRIARALCLESAIVAVGGKRARNRALRLIQTADALADEVDADELVAWVPGARAFVDYQLGMFGSAREHAARSVKVLRERCRGVAWETASVEQYLLWALFYLGEIREMTARVAWLVENARERGDRYAYACLRTGLCGFPWIAAGATDEARAGAEDAVTHWSDAHGFHLQHYWAMLALANCDLYERRPEAAYRRVLEPWRAFRGSLLLGMQAVQIEALHLRGRVTVAAAAAAHEPPRELIRSALADARRLARIGLPWGDAAAAMVRASAATLTEPRSTAADAFAAAEAACVDPGLALWAAAARWRRGELAGDDTALAAAEAWLTRQGAVAPERVVAVVAPARLPAR